jgi:hypothetical protein
MCCVSGECGGVGWAKLARALYIVSPAVTMSADARNRLCGVYHTAFIRSSLEIRISVREVETLASFILRTPTERFRAAHSNALRGFRNMKPYGASIGRVCGRGRPRQGEALPMRERCLRAGYRKRSSTRMTSSLLSAIS